MFCLEMVAQTKTQDTKLEVAELKMLRLSLGVMRMDRIRNKHISGTAQVGCFRDTVREPSLKTFRNVQTVNILAEVCFRWSY